MLLSKCAVCDSNKIKFIKEQEARGTISKLKGKKVPILSDIPIAIFFFLTLFGMNVGFGGKRGPATS